MAFQRSTRRRRQHSLDWNLAAFRSHTKRYLRRPNMHAVSKPGGPFFGESSLRPPMREKSACKKSPNKGRKSRQRRRRPSFGSALCSTAGLIRSQQQSRPRSYSVPPHRTNAPSSSPTQAKAVVWMMSDARPRAGIDDYSSPLTSSSPAGCQVEKLFLSAEDQK